MMRYIDYCGQTIRKICLQQSICNVRLRELFYGEVQNSGILHSCVEPDRACLKEMHFHYSFAYSNKFNLCLQYSLYQLP